MTPSYESLLNLATADRAVVTRLDSDANRPERWYVLVADASNGRAAGVCGRDSWMLLWDSPDAAMNWLREQQPELAAQEKSAA